jgi:single-strand DNA-binding protein
MSSFNKVILVGNVTREIELRYTSSQMAVTELGLAVNDRRKGTNGEWIEDTTFVDCTLWGRTAEVANEYVKKGSSVLVEGRLKLDTWEKDGQKRSKLSVVAERMQMLGGKGGAKEEAPPAKSQSMKQDVNRKALAERDPDDIPFSLLWFVIPIASALAAIA